MRSSSITAIFSADIKKVWDIVRTHFINGKILRMMIIAQAN